SRESLRSRQQLLLHDRDEAFLRVERGVFDDAFEQCLQDLAELRSRLQAEPLQIAAVDGESAGREHRMREQRRMRTAPAWAEVDVAALDGVRAPERETQPEEVTYPVRLHVAKPAAHAGRWCVRREECVLQSYE